uniref:Uncharacterized protein n=1 Tax=Nelumbo nucifera TaxID=4432 RepID=A0A822Z643_NELNU|nr:TPA_asm: hypothetical protein HUJ06_007649 [Nelumbo nucifera]
MNYESIPTPPPSLKDLAKVDPPAPEVEISLTKEEEEEEGEDTIQDDNRASLAKKMYELQDRLDGTKTRLSILAPIKSCHNIKNSNNNTSNPDTTRFNKSNFSNVHRRPSNIGSGQGSSRNKSSTKTVITLVAFTNNTSFIVLNCH